MKTGNGRRQILIAVLIGMVLCAGTGCTLLRPHAGDDWDPRDDSADGATILPLLDGTDPQVHGLHSLGINDREDWYRIHLSALSTVVFEGCNGQGDPYVELLEDLGGTTRLLAENDNCGKDEMFMLIVDIERSGWYYLRVTTSEPGQYAIYDLKYWVRQTAQPDAWDPTDDSTESPTSLSEPGVHGPHTLSPSDTSDWFRLYLRADRDVTVETVVPYGDTILRIYSESGERLAYNDDGGPGLASRIHFSPPTQGWYYVLVTSYAQRMTSYSLSWEEIEDDSTSSNDLDPWDAQDGTLAGATRLTTPLQSASHHGPHRVSGDDEDWFEAYLVEGHRYVFEATDTTGDTLAALYRIDTSGQRIYLVQNNDSGAGLAFRVVYTAEVSGFYYLRVISIGSASAAYTLEYGELR